MTSDTTHRWEQKLFLALIAFHLSVVWSMPVFLTQDGPSHLYNARILLELWSGDPSGLYSRFFTVNTHFSPNWTGNIVLAALLKVFPSIAAEKVLVSAYMIGLPLAFRHAVRTLTQRTPWLALFVFFFTYNYHLIYGFFNFCLGLALLFWFLAALHRLLAAPELGRGVGCTVLLFALLLTHPVPYIVALLWAGCTFIQRMWAQRGDERKMLTVLRWTSGVALPSTVLFIYFVVKGPSSGDVFVNKLNGDTLKAFFNMDHAVVFPGIEPMIFHFIAVLLTLLLLVVTVLAVRARTRLAHGPLFILFLLCVGIHFFVSDELAGGAYLTSRMALIAWMVLALWVALQPMPHWLRTSALVGTAAFGIQFVLDRKEGHSTCADLAMEYIEHARAVPEGATLLPLCFSNRGEFGGDLLSPRISLFKHLSGYVAAERRIISLDNYEAHTSYFQTAWLPGVDPFTQLCANGDCDIEGRPWTADVLGYEQRSGATVDAVIIWGDAQTIVELPGWSFQHDEEPPFTQVYTLFSTRQAHDKDIASAGSGAICRFGLYTGRKLD